jgi:hypothetical protein
MFLVIPKVLSLKGFNQTNYTKGILPLNSGQTNALMRGSSGTTSTPQVQLKLMQNTRAQPTQG